MRVKLRLRGIVKGLENASLQTPSPDPLHFSVEGVLQTTTLSPAVLIGVGLGFGGLGGFGV